jgi:hypothetical protein
MADIQQTADNVREALPLELQGFVIAAIVVVGIVIVMTVFFKLMGKRLHMPETAPSGDVKPKSKQLKTSAKIKRKTREIAQAMGFMADDVSRDVPVDLTFMPRTQEVKPRTCARYVYPEHVERNAEWTLLKRPWAEENGDVGKGWQLDWRRGDRDAETMAMIKTVTHDARWKNRFLEMELARNTLIFYWDEFGGKAEVQNLLSCQQQLKPVASAQKDRT